MPVILNYTQPPRSVVASPRGEAISRNIRFLLIVNEIAHLHCVHAHTCPSGRCQGLLSGETAKRPRNDGKLFCNESFLYSQPGELFINVEFVQTEKLALLQEKALEQLSEAVDPPDRAATRPGKSVTWASPQWSILLWEHDALVTHVGLLVREILQDGTMKRIGGVGGVATHPAKQRRGFASQGMREAAERFDREFAISYALLFCRAELVPFYERLQWKPFMGKIFVEQPQGKIEFTLNGAMVLDVREQAPQSGILDLNGLPW